MYLPGTSRNRREKSSRRSHPLRTERLAFGHVVTTPCIFGKTARFFVDFSIWKFFKKGQSTSVNPQSTLAQAPPEIAANSKEYRVLYKKSIENTPSKRLTKITVFQGVPPGINRIRVKNDSRKSLVCEKIHLTEIQVSKIPPQCNHGFRNSASVKPKFPKFHFSAITVSKIPGSENDSRKSPVSGNSPR